MVIVTVAVALVDRIVSDFCRNNRRFSFDLLVVFEHLSILFVVVVVVAVAAVLDRMLLVPYDAIIRSYREREREREKMCLLSMFFITPRLRQANLRLQVYRVEEKSNCLI